MNLKKKLLSEYRKEKKEHSWASPELLRRIAADHVYKEAKKNRR